MSHTEFHVRQATQNDVSRIVQLEKEIWRVTGVEFYAEAHVRNWLSVFPQGLLVAEHEGKTIGYSGSQLTNINPLQTLPFATYQQATDYGTHKRTHCPDGKSWQMVHLISTIPGGASVLTKRVYELCQEYRMKWYYACPHLSGFHDFYEGRTEKEEDVALWYTRTYTERKGSKIWNVCPPLPPLDLPLPPPDKVLDCHLKHGAGQFGLVGLLPNFMTDTASKNWAALFAIKLFKS